MTRLLLLALGLLAGYAARRPVCERAHALPRHLDPAIVDREDDEGILQPDPRTWHDPVPILTSAAASSALPVNVTITPKVALGPRWPETLEHDFMRWPHVPGAWGDQCRRCMADRWLRGARRA